MKLKVLILTLVLPWSVVSGQNTSQASSPVDYSPEQVHALLQSAAMMALQGVTTIHYERKVVFSLQETKELWRKRVADTSRRMDETPGLGLTEAQKSELAHEPTVPMIRNSRGDVVLEFQDFSKWRLTWPASEISGSLQIIADGSGFVFQHHEGFEGCTVFPGEADSVFALHTHDILPWANLVPLGLEQSDSIPTPQKWAASTNDRDFVECAVIEHLGNEIFKTSFEISADSGILNNVTESFDRTYHCVWTRLAENKWRLEVVLKDMKGETTQTDVIDVDVFHRPVVAFPVSTFASPLKSGDRVTLGPVGDQIELPAEAFLERKVKFEDLQKVFDGLGRNSTIKKTIDGAAQRIEDIKTLPPEIKKPLQDAADGAKKLLQGAETAPQESAPVTPQ